MRVEQRAHLGYWTAADRDRVPLSSRTCSAAADWTHAVGVGDTTEG
ncbi:hypothetical protein [Amycolatopsis decaplanina]|nr:hypothetical protein [Amycolatopsis decaplanina]